MKLNNNSIINVVENEHYINHHVNFLNSVKLNDLDKLNFYEERISFFKEKRFRRLVLSNKTSQNLSNYLVPKEIRYNVLRSLPNRIDSILLDKNNLLRYIKTDEVIIGMFDMNGDDGALYNYFFRMDLVNETLLINSGEGRNTDTDIQKSYSLFLQTFFSKFMVVVTYLELTPVTLDVIEGGRSFGTKKEGKIKNETNKKFILVNTNWNVEKIDLRDIHVRGHWRLQPYGSGRSQYKYIYIQPFEKGITRRLPQKELVS